MLSLAFCTLLFFARTTVVLGSAAPDSILESRKGSEWKIQMSTKTFELLTRQGSI